jgi:hypothetical protein
VPVAVDDANLTMDPTSAAAAVTANTRAAVITHLHGVMADVQAIRASLPADVVGVENAAQALGAPSVGRLGDLPAFSLGPGKAASAGELGFLVTPDRDRFIAAVRASQHPVRQLLTGIDEPDGEILMIRAASAAALAAIWKLTRWAAQLPQLNEATARLADALADAGVHVLCRSSPGRLPLLVDDHTEAVLHGIVREVSHPCWTVSVSMSGARPDPRLRHGSAGRALDTLRRVRVVAIESDRRVLGSSLP